MNIKISLMAMVAAATLSLGSAAFAATTAPTESVTLNGDNGGPWGQGQMNNWVDSLNLYEPGFALYELDSVVRPDTGTGDLEVTYSTPARSGSWEWTGSDPVNFVVYQAVNKFVVQYFEDGITQNDWDTVELGLLNQSSEGRRLTNITLYGVDGSELRVQAVPLPAGGLLLIMGLGTLAIGRRRRS